MPAPVHDAHHTDDGWEDPVIHGIGEPTQQHSSECWGHQRIGVEGLANPVKGFVTASRKRLATSRDRAAYHVVGLTQLRIRDRAEANPEH